MNKKYLIILILLILILITSLNIRVYHGLNSGIVSDYGGLEIKPYTGLFICEGIYNPNTDSYKVNPLASLFPSFVVDC